MSVVLPLHLTKAQRTVLSQLRPDLSDRLSGVSERFVELPLDELAEIKAAAAKAAATTQGAQRSALKQIAEKSGKAIRKAEAATITGPIYQFKITLLGTAPEIWRRVLTPDCTLLDLHDVIQTAMGWGDEHLHEFAVGKQRFGLSEDAIEYEENYRDEREVLVSELRPPRKKLVLEYEYDFGDSWRHEIVLEEVLEAVPCQHYPLCVDGAEACPPDDIGGVYGYYDALEEFIELRKNHTGADSQDDADGDGAEFDDGRFSDWFPDDYDPHAFSRDAINARFKSWRR